MTKKHPENIRIKREYFAFLKEAKRNSEQSVDAAAGARPVRSLCAEAFQRVSRSTGRRLQSTPRQADESPDRATIEQGDDTRFAGCAESLFHLACRSTGIQVTNHSDAEYFNLSAKDIAIARSEGE
jgi:integrase/recombinase XerD